MAKTSTAKRVGYNVYHAPEGCGETYLGQVGSLREARKLAAQHARNPGSGLPGSLYGTAQTAGHCAGMSAPDKRHEMSEPTEWFGRGGWYCAVGVLSQTEICGRTVQHDNSGVGHNWRDVEVLDLPAKVVE